MAHSRTVSEINAELHTWYEARTAAAAGKSFMLVTSAGTRSMTSQNLSEINMMIDKLERELANASSTDTTRQGLHSFALANMGDNGANS